MDIDQALNDARCALAQIRNYQAGANGDTDAIAAAGETLADSFEAIDEWLCRSGSLPRYWQR